MVFRSNNELHQWIKSSCLKFVPWTVDFYIIMQYNQRNAHFLNQSFNF